MATLLDNISLVEVPALSAGRKMATDDTDMEKIFVHQKRGPMIYNMVGRMVPFKTASPAQQLNSFQLGPMTVPMFDRGAGQLTNTYHIWQNKTNTQMKIDLLTVAKKNHFFRGLQGEEFCRRQEFEFLVQALPVRRGKKRKDDDELRVGDSAECIMQEGEFEGMKILCRILSAGSEPGTFNCRVPPQPPIVPMSTDAPDIPLNILTKLRVTCWRVTYKLGMDIRESQENDGPIKNNVLRTRPTLNVGQAVRIVQEVAAPGGITYLRLEDGRGWIFDQKPGVGVACIRDENAIDMAEGIQMKLPDDDDGVTDLDVLGRRLRDSDAPTIVAGLQKVKPDERFVMLAQMSQAKHDLVLDFLRAECIAMPLLTYLLDNAKSFGAGQAQKDAPAGFGEM